MDRQAYSMLLHPEGVPFSSQGVKPLEGWHLPTGDAYVVK